MTINFGTPEFLVMGGGSLLIEVTRLLKARRKQVSVLTSDRQLPAIKEPLERDNIAYRTVADVNSFDEVKRITPATLGISIGAPWILTGPFLAAFGGKLINLHGAPLPEHRGAGGFSWRILQDDRRGSALIHQIDGGIDTGAIVMREDYLFPDSCKVPRDFEAYSVGRYQFLMERFLDQVDAGNDFSLSPQDERASSYWPRLATDIHGFIDWSWCAKDLVRFISAFDDPHPGASTYLNGTRVRLRQAALGQGTFHPFQSGLIYRLHGSRVHVAATEGSVIVNLEGAAPKVGLRLHTPREDLEQARLHRAVYTPQKPKK